ncbi:hypothetical protein PVAND_004094 [Polypedilum vanderplanki]|uniref:Exocyst complex component 1 n=1 Tax=Polypedilum vanderplanki TaxID=319348 RepID=A0A9J6BX63_POLVA|nr:hypothetical protein PVAND_004094 [Polypedilum vanderplanki]
MSGIKNLLLQNECFNEEETKILSVLSVCKLNAKKSRATSVLVLVCQNVTNFLQIVEIKIGEKEFKKKKSWLLDEFKLIDVKFNEHEFEFILNDDSKFQFAAILLNEKQIFLTSVYKYVKKSPLIMNKAIFKNIPDAWKVDDNIIHMNDTKKQEDDIITNIEFDDFKELNELELMLQTDSHKWLLKEHTSVIRNADRFIEYLSKNLIELDGANVESILASKAEEKVLNLMQIIDTAIDEVECVERILDEYEEIMSNIRDSMEKMGEKNSMIEIANKNNLKLLQELEKVISQLDLSHAYQIALTETDLTTIKGLQAAKDSGRALQNAMLNADIDPTLLRLAAVQDQRKRFDKWKAKFINTISRHLNNLFIHLGNDLGEQHSSSGNELKLTKHNHHRELNGYQELMHLMKVMDINSYEALTKVYTNSLSKVYERDLHQFFDQAKWMVTKNHVHEDINLSITSKSKVQTVKVPVYGILGIPKDQWSTVVVDANERQRFDAIFEKVLTEIDPVALNEQIFCINFFQLDVLSPTLSGKNVPSFTPNKDAPSSSSLTPTSKRLNEEVRRMMAELFGILESELLGFIMNFEKLDPFYSLYVFVRLNQHVMTAQDAQSFLSMTYASVLIQVKRNFDRFMQLQLQSIQESKVPKRSKCGLLCYVENFEEFATLTENIFRKSERRTDLDKWYVKLVDSIFIGINQLSLEHSKTPSQVIKMENYHHMHSQLARLKVPVLDNLKKEAKIRYNEALRAYVTKYFGRPLEKLNQFFEGVQIKVSQGIKESEISYQMAFSKQELRKVIAQYPQREVKKGLENLYKKVEKHLCEEENLLQVVWRAMQEEFLAQLAQYEEFISRCYPGSMITLDFTIDEILNFFSDIARSH